MNKVLTKEDNTELILTFEEINNASSIDELISLYESKGCSFNRQNGFLNFLEKQWAKHRVQIRKQAFSQEKILPLEVVAGDETFNIFGVVHEMFMFGFSFSPPYDYKSLVRESIPNRGTLFAEHYLLDYSTFRSESIVEMPDHVAAPYSTALRGFRANFFSGLMITPVLALGVALLPYTLWRNKRTRKNEDSGKELYGSFLPLVYDGNKNSLLHKLPPVVEIELREQRGIGRYNTIQARSAYQAEFARYSKCEGGKNLVVGAIHTQEIEYFLKKGTKDQRIVDLAGSHAELLQEDQNKYTSLLKNIRGGHKAVALAGFLSGLSIPSYALYQLIF